MSHEGALETVIAEQLADACAAYLRTRTDPESQATQLAKRLVARAAKTSAIEMAGLVAKQLLGILASRLGPDAAAAIGRVLEDLTHTADEALERRLRLQSGADALRQLMGLAAETVSAIGDVLVVLDGGERLSDSDFALLRDLPGFLPARVTVLLGLTTADTAQHEKANLLGISGGLVIELPALRLEHIQTWLADQTLPAEHAKEVLTRTNGYPLLVDSAIAYLLAGKSLSELPPGDTLANLTRISWGHLSSDARAAAFRLCAFSSALTTEEILALLDLRFESWLALREELIRNRIFTLNEEWFHDRRRWFLWHEFMTSTDRARIAEELLPTVQTWALDASSGINGLANFASLLPYAPRFRSTTPDVELISNLRSDALATLSALLELSEPSGALYGFVETSQLLAYLRNRGLADNAVFVAISTLSESGLAYVVDQDLSLISPTVPSPTALACIVGRCLLEFRRAPLPVWR